MLDVTLASIRWARVTCKNKNFRALQRIFVTELSACTWIVLLLTLFSSSISKLHFYIVTSTISIAFNMKRCHSCHTLPYIIKMSIKKAHNKTLLTRSLFCHCSRPHTTKCKCHVGYLLLLVHISICTLSYDFNF